MRNSTLVLTVFAAGFVSALFALLFVQWYYVDEYTTTVTFSVVEETRVGFDLNTSAIAFGKVPRSGSAERVTTLSSRVDTIAHVRLRSPLDEVVSVLPNPVRVHGSPVDVLFRLTVPHDMALGNYTGTARVQYVRRLPWR